MSQTIYESNNISQIKPNIKWIKERQQFSVTIYNKDVIIDKEILYVHLSLKFTLLIISTY